MKFTDAKNNPDPKEGGNRRIRTVVRIAVRCFLGVLLAIAAVLIALQIPPIARWSARTALAIANPWEGASTSLGDVGGNWLTSLELINLRISNAEGTLVLSIDSLRVGYDLTGLLQRKVLIDECVLRRPVVASGIAADGSWTLTAPFGAGKQTPDSSAPLAISVDRISITDGEFRLAPGDAEGMAPLELRQIAIYAHGILIAKRITASLDSLHAMYITGERGEDHAVIEAAGTIAESLIVVDHFSLLSPRSSVLGRGKVSLPLSPLESLPEASISFSAKPVSYQDIHPFVSALGPAGEAAFEVNIHGDREHLQALAHLEVRQGGTAEVRLDARNSRAGVLALRVEGSTQAFSLAGLTGRSDSSEKLNSSFEARGEGSLTGNFIGSASVLLTDSYIAGLGPLSAGVKSTIEKGTVHARIQGSVRPASFSLEASIEPFNPSPPYELSGTVWIPKNFGSRPDPLLRRLAGLQCSVSASGEGFSATSSRASVMVDAAWERNPHLRSFTLKAGLSEGLGHVQALVTTTGGRADLHASGRFGSEVEYSIDSLTFRNFDIAAILGDSTASLLNGSLRAAGRGTDPRHLSAEARIHLDPSRLAHLEIWNADLFTTLSGGILRADGAAFTGGGSIRLQTSADPFGDTPSLGLQTLAFQSLDLGRLLDAGSPSTDLSGSLNADVRFGSARDLERFLHGRGMADSTGGAATLTLGKSRFNKQEIQGAVQAALRGGEVVVDGEIFTPEGGMSIRGSGRPFDGFPGFDLSRIDLRGVDIGKLAGWNYLTTDFTGNASARLSGGTPDSARLSISVDLAHSRVNHEPLARGSIRGILEGGNVDITADLLFDRGRVLLDGQGVMDADCVTGTLKGSTHLDDIRRLLLMDSLATSSLFLDFAVHGTWGSAEKTRLEGRFTGHGQLDSLRVDSVECGFSVKRRTAEIDTLHLSSNAVELSAHGAIAAFDSGSASNSSFLLTAMVNSLKPFERLAGFESGLFDGAVASLSLRGPPDQTSASVEVKNHVAEVEQIFVSSLDVTAHATLAPGLRVKTVEADASVGAMYYGSVGIEQSVFHVVSDGRRHGLQASFSLEEGSTGRLVGTAHEETGVMTIGIDTLRIVGPKATWSLDHPTSVSVGKGVQVREFKLGSDAGKIVIDGRLAPAGEQDFSLSADFLSLGQIARILGRPELDGTLSFGARVSGPSSAAHAAGDLSAEIVAGDRPLGTIQGKLEWIDSLLTIDGIVRQPNGRQLVASATIHETLSLQKETRPSPAMPGQITGRASDFSLRTENFDLSIIRPFLNPKMVAQVQGILSADILGKGWGETLQAKGSFVVDSGRVSLPALGATYDSIRVVSTLEGQDLRIQNARVTSGEGLFTGAGTVNFRNLDTLRPDLALKGTNFLVLQTPSAKVTVSGDLHVRGTVATPTVGGNLELRDSYFTIPETGDSKKVESVELTEEDYAMLEKWFGYRRRTVSRDSTSPGLGLTLDLDLAIERNTWIRKRQNPTLALELEGDVSIHSQPRQLPRITGILRPLKGRSYVGQFGRQFDITDGEILFNGALEELELRVGSEYKVQSKGGSGRSEVLIRMNVESKLGRYTFRLTSDPAMDESEILSYLATGKSSSGALANTADQGGLGGAVALEQLVGAAGGLTEGKIPLDVFQIRQEGARGITIVAGNYVTPKTYLGIRAPILMNQGTEDTYYDVGSQFEVEYEASPWLFLNFQGGSSRVLFLLKSRYAY